MIAGLESFGVKKNNSSPNAIHVVRPLAVDDFRDQSVDIRLDACDNRRSAGRGDFHRLHAPSQTWLY